MKPLCKDCKSYKPAITGNDDIACTHPEVANTDPVHGALMIASCRKARTDSWLDVGCWEARFELRRNSCGIAGRYHEAKSTKPTVESILRKLQAPLFASAFANNPKITIDSKDDIRKKLDKAEAERFVKAEEEAIRQKFRSDANKRHREILDLIDDIECETTKYVATRFRTPRWIGVDMASGPDETVIGVPGFPAWLHIPPNPPRRSPAFPDRRGSKPQTRVRHGGAEYYVTDSPFLGRRPFLNPDRRKTGAERRSSVARRKASCMFEAARGERTRSNPSTDRRR